MINTTARIISFIFHPLLIIILATFLVTFHSSKNIPLSFFWAFAAAVIASGIFIFEAYGIRKGYFSDFDVSRRKDRWRLFLFAFVCACVFLLSILFFGGPTELFWGGIYITTGIIVFGIVNRVIKASIHVAGMSSFFVSMAILYGGFFYLGILFIPLVAWSRVELKRHTISEVIVGSLIGILLTLMLWLVIQYSRFI